MSEQVIIQKLEVTYQMGSHFENEVVVVAREALYAVRNSVRPMFGGCL